MEVYVNPKVSEWLLKQPWRSEFIDHYMKSNYNNTSLMLKTLLGGDYDGSINNFFWLQTPEGDKFWSDLDTELHDLYENGNWEEEDAAIEV